MEQAKVEAAVEELAAVLRFTRGEAIARGQEVWLGGAGAALEKGWSVTSTNFGGGSVLLRDHARLNGVKVCTEANVCDLPIAFVFSPRGSLSAEVNGSVVDRADMPVKLLVRPELFRQAGEPATYGAGLRLHVNAMGSVLVLPDDVPQSTT
ncbi:MAG: GspH/FimT family protein [Zoogloeaceae bacterium]|nr:GspH/FimT family protein [Zoogloeaceae bacterium]